jgi:hypothetical protein
MSEAISAWDDIVGLALAPDQFGRVDLRLARLAAQQ